MKSLLAMPPIVSGLMMIAASLLLMWVMMPGWAIIIAYIGAAVLALGLFMGGIFLLAREAWRADQ